MWKDIPNWENYYEINELEEVRNKITKKLIIGDTNNAGYPRIYLYNKNNSIKKERFFRHRLVALLFIPNPNNYLEVNHIDGNKLNSNVNNLEWCTRKQDERHSYKVGGSKHKNYKPFKIIYDNGLEEIYNFKEDLSKLLGISRVTVKYWLQKKNKGFRKYKIKDIYYI